MLQTVTWKAIPRKNHSKSQIKNMRKKGFIPASISGKNFQNIDVYLNQTDVSKRPEGAFKINLEIEELNESTQCILKQIQYDYIKNEILHLELYALKPDEKVEVSIPVEIVGKAKGEEYGGIVNQIVDHIVIRTYPDKIPEYIEVDISNLNLHESIKIEDLKLDNEIELVEPKKGVIVSISTSGSSDNEEVATKQEEISA
ncbi:50S ribosomal protein L25 [Deferribacter autotrophicus]|uniref:Large ribosomal subunit protein bL25 n=1 Tax=Deferribacter autotrophicus TaxID=500465 RepID=A0A5A8F2G0_9BACT|nr:50S ribosomal protein L25 [Deferribacter autotrophicus]KAA0258132.1 50S ribosomal protein L25 [Deferribacter autotrophicus]